MTKIGIHIVTYILNMVATVNYNFARAMTYIGYPLLEDGQHMITCAKVFEFDGVLCKYHALFY